MPLLGTNAMPTVAVNARPQLQKGAGPKAMPKKTNVGTSSTISRVKAKLKLKEIVQMPNVATALTKQQRDEIGSGVVEGYRIDLSTRMEWIQRNSEGLKLALQLKEEKTFPWVNCSNVKFPLITSCDPAIPLAGEHPDEGEVPGEV